MRGYGVIVAFIDIRCSYFDRTEVPKPVRWKSLLAAFGWPVFSLPYGGLVALFDARGTVVVTAGGLLAFG